MGERFDMSRPIYAQIVERLKAKILAGVYPPGGHLDSVRDMAAAAGVNPNTMQRALAQLEAEAQVRSGNFQDAISTINQLRARAEWKNGDSVKAFTADKAIAIAIVRPN